MTGDLIALSPPSDDCNVRAKVFGVGSAGCNMAALSALPSVALSTSKADLERSNAQVRTLVSPERLIGLYQTDPAILRQSVSVAGSDMHRLFTDTDVAFLLAGLGGVSGSLGTAILGQLAKANGSLSIAIVSSPFSAESERRRDFASKCLRRIVASNDLCIAFGNDALSQLAPHLPLSKAFAVMNSILHRPMLDLASSVDRRDLKTLRKVIGDSRFGRFGFGMGRGDGRVGQTVDEALSSPWFDFDLEDVDAAVAIYSAADPWEKERSLLLELIQRRIGECQILHGTYRDESLRDKIRLSLLLLRKP